MALMASGKHIEPVEAVQMAYWNEIDKEIESIPESEKNKSKEEKEIEEKEKQAKENGQEKVNN